MPPRSQRGPMSLFFGGCGGEDGRVLRGVVIGWPPYALNDAPMTAVHRAGKVIGESAVIVLAGKRRRTVVPDPEIDMAAARAHRYFVHVRRGSVPYHVRLALRVVAGHDATNRFQSFSHDLPFRVWIRIAMPTRRAARCHGSIVPQRHAFPGHFGPAFTAAAIRSVSPLSRIQPILP